MVPPREDVRDAGGPNIAASAGPTTADNRLTVARARASLRSGATRAECHVSRWSEAWRQLRLAGPEAAASNHSERNSKVDMVQRVATVEERLRKVLGDDLLTREPLRHHTTFRIGGPADFTTPPAPPEALVAALRIASTSGCRCSCSAVAATCWSRTRASAGWWCGTRSRGSSSTARPPTSAAAPTSSTSSISVATTSSRASSSRPASPARSAARCTATRGATGRTSAASRSSARSSTPDGSSVVTRPASWFEFAYRDSRLKRDPKVLLSCLLQFRRGDRAEIQTVIDEKLEIRRVKHPQWRVEPTAGSYFKNLPPDWQMPGAKHSPGTRRVPAGQLLDEVGCRGLRVGDAMVFAKHANIIVNAGHASARDVLELAATMKAKRAREVRRRARGRGHVPRRTPGDRRRQWANPTLLVAAAPRCPFPACQGFATIPPDVRNPLCNVPCPWPRRNPRSERRPPQSSLFLRWQHTAFLLTFPMFPRRSPAEASMFLARRGRSGCCAGVFAAACPDVFHWRAQRDQREFRSRQLVEHDRRDARHRSRSASGTHLLISEVGARGASLATIGGAPDSSEFIEIYNPTANPDPARHQGAHQRRHQLLPRRQWTSSGRERQRLRPQFPKA